MTDDTDDMTAEEFEQKTDELETDDEMFEEDAGNERELLSFSDLLDLREDITAVTDQLDQTAGYYAQSALVLEEQVEVAEDRGEAEKAGALRETAEKARAVAERIDGGEVFADIEEARAEVEGEDDG